VVERLELAKYTDSLDNFGSWPDPVPREVLEHGACKAPEVPTSWFFPGSGRTKDIARAKATCGGCEVRRACLAYALADTSIMGVWGGSTDRERTQIRLETRRRGIERAA
jgi:hypothetical protein